MVVAYILQTLIGAVFWKIFARETLRQSVLVSAFVLPNITVLLAFLTVGLLSLLNGVEEILRK